MERRLVNMPLKCEVNSKKLLQEISNHPDYQYNNVTKLWEYIGKLRAPLKHWAARRAQSAWNGQGARCNNIKDINYKYYGAKGSKRIWISRECINFFINQLLKREKWFDPVISRYNDIGNYEEKNCKVIEQSENNSEKKISDKMRETCKQIVNKYRSHAIKKLSKPVLLTNINNSKEKISFNSARDCDRYFKLCRTMTTSCILHNRILKINNKKYKASYIDNK